MGQAVKFYGEYISEENWSGLCPWEAGIQTIEDDREDKWVL